MSSFLNPIEDAIGWLLSSLYSLPPHNLGFAIILMTAVVMLIMMPLTAKQVRSMVAMQKLQPEIKKLQQQYKDDRQKQSEEVMKFYKENQINPLAGCLPLVVQFPVWISLYRTLKEIPNHIKTSSLLYQKMCERVSVKDCLKTPKHSLQFLGMDLRSTLLQAKDHTNFAGLLPYGLLVAFVVATGIIQTRQTMARQRRQSPDQPMNPQMQTMMRIMPVMNIMTAFFPVGVALYWGARNVWMIGQQHFVMNKFYADPASEMPTPPVSDEQPVKPSTNPNTSKKKQQQRRKR